MKLKHTVSTEDLLKITSDIITPILKIERTMVMPFDHNRHENVGEHSFSIAVLVGALAHQIDPDLDIGKLMQYAVMHDIVELHAGDVTVWASDEALLMKEKHEQLAARRIKKDFIQFPWLSNTYIEFTKLDTPEKKFVYAIDKLYPHLLIIVSNHHPVKPSWEAYKRTENIAIKKIGLYPPLLNVFKTLCQTFRERPHFFSTPIPNEDKILI